MADEGSIGRAGRYWALAFDFSASFGAGVVVGWFFDQQFETGPYGSLFFIIGAVGVGFVRLVQALRRFDRIDRERGS